MSTDPSARNAPSPPAPSRRWRIVATLALAGSLVVNALANTLPLNNRSTGELAALYPNLFQPAGLTFSIWSAIYLALLAWAVAQFVRSRPVPPVWTRLSGPLAPASRRALGEAIAPLFAAACVLNTLWLFAWHWERVALSVVVMLGLLASLVLLNARLAGSRFLLPRLAFGLYLGWIVVATVANVTALLVDLGWSGRVPGLGWLMPGMAAPAVVWAAGMAAVGALVLRETILRLEATWVGAAGTWALAGIVLARYDDHPVIAAVAALGAVLVLATALRMGCENRERARQAAREARTVRTG